MLITAISLQLIEILGQKIPGLIPQLHREGVILKLEELTKSEHVMQLKIVAVGN